MCVQLMKIKSKSDFAQKFAFIPCGHCEECRDSVRSQWFFRLRAELDWCHKHKFHIGFFTLTYSDSAIPRVPEHLIGNKQLFFEKGAPFCFSRSDVRTFIDNIRKRVFEIVGKTKEDKRIRYMICSEFGSSEYTARSHYHGLICFPPEVKPEVMFSLIKSNWTDKGHVFPRYINGGVDRHGYKHQPFLLRGDVSRAARYASKYCTKDLNFSESLYPYHIDTKAPDYKNCKCFHIQSKSIGLSYLSTLPTDRLLDILKNGVSYIGDKKRRSLPLYLKNKILFNPKYTFEPCPTGDWYYDFEADKWRYSKSKGTHKRLVGKVASAFFYRNVEQIFNMKVEYYAQLFKDMQQPSFWQARVNQRRTFLPKDRIVEKASRFGAFFSKFDSYKLAVGYLCYFGIPYESCYFTAPHVAYLHRYVDKVYPETLPEFEPWTGMPLVNRDYYDCIQSGLGSVIDFLKYCECTDYEQREKVARVNDFYKHAI